MTTTSTDWQLYIIECEDGSLYTGVTNNILRRFHQHRSGKGAKYFRRSKPLQLVYQELGYSRQQAQQREYAVKQLTAKQKRQLINKVKT